MALPVRISREQSIDPFEIIRNDFQMLNRFFGNGGIGGDGGDGGPLGLLSSFPVDVREDENHVIVEAELPGFNKDEIAISFEDGMLMITAEHREEIAEPAEAQQSQEGQDAGGVGRGGSGAEASGGTAAGAATKGAARQGRRRQQDQGNYLLRERHVQRFVRSFTLPPNVEEQNVQATYENGVLRITLNKREESKPKRVQIS